MQSRVCLGSMHMHPSFRYEILFVLLLCFRWLVVVVDRPPPHQFFPVFRAYCVGLLTLQLGWGFG